MRRTERLFALAEHLRARRTGVTAEELAERFGVTVRTLYRDLASLKVAHLPLQAERGRGGGYALDRAYTLPPVNFSAREAAVLISAGEFLTRMRVLPFAATLARAVDKVRGALDASAQRRLSTLMQTVQFIGVPARPCAPGVQEAVEQAWFERSSIRIVYHKANDTQSERTVRVERLILDLSETLLLCTDLDINESREFRMHRILEVRPQ